MSLTLDPDPTAESGAFDRRAFFARPAARAAAAAAVLGGATALTACDLTGKPFDRELHLLRRLTYGPEPVSRARLASIGEEAWMSEQTDPSSLDTSAVDAKLAQLPALSMTPVELDANFTDGADARRAAAQLKLAFAIRAVHSPAQLHERMVEFWSDHFNVPTADRNLSLLKIVEDREVIRPHALGSFKDLLVASAQSPAMLLYLDNAFSFSGKINENYSRELLELHTVGRGGGYDEDDVVSLARLLTGWSINRTTFEFEFRAARHDGGALSILGWDRPAGTDELQHGVDFLHHLAQLPATAEFVCTKIARRFVTDFPSPDLIGAMTAAWSSNDTAIVPVLEAMVNHPAFEDSANGKFRRPLDYLAFVARAMRCEVEPTANVGQLLTVHRYLSNLGQVPFAWPAPNGFPDVEGAWLNAGGLLSRWNLVGDLFAGEVPGIEPDLSEIADPQSGQPAHDIYDAFADALVFEPTKKSGRIVLDQATGWNKDSSPDGADFLAGIGPIAITLLTSTDAQYC